MVLRRWRGEIDMPLTDHGRQQAAELGLQLRDRLDVVYHDWLSRCRDTARALEAPTVETRGSRPWRMGRRFEGNPITPESIQHAEWFVRHPQISPDFGGEPWGEWYRDWMGWLRCLPKGRVGIVTHNRNIQAVLATVDGVFDERVYNCDGPNFCSVNEWNGVLLIRHGETSFGT